MTLIKNIKKYIFPLLLSLAALIIWGSGINYGQYIKEYYQSIGIRLKKDRISEKELVTALQYEAIKNPDHVPSISAWNCLEEQTVINEELTLSYKTRLIEFYGDIHQVYPVELTAGNIMIQDDYQGCIIDEEVAYQLFGTINPVGNSIRYRNQLFFIRGVIKSPKPVLLLTINDKNHTYSNLELVYENKENGHKLAKDFILQNNLPYAYTILDNSLYGSFLDGFYRVPAWFLNLYILFHIAKAIWKRRTLPLQAFILLIGFLSVFLLLKWLLEFQISIPDHFIPTKWSDFSFWSEKHKEIQEQIDQIAYLPPTVKDILFLRYAKRCVNYTLISLASMWIFASHIKIILSKIEGFPLAVLAILLEWSVIFILFQTGKGISVNNGFLYIIPIFIMGTDYVKKGRHLLHSISLD